MRHGFRRGQSLKVKKMNYQNPSAKRLIDMGITPGSSIYIHKIAPMGDPYIVKVRDYYLAVRKKDLETAEFENKDCN